MSVLKHVICGKTHTLYYKENLIAKTTIDTITIFPDKYPFYGKHFCTLITNFLSEIYYMAKVTIRNDKYVYSDNRNKKITFKKNEDKIQIYIGRQE